MAFRIQGSSKLADDEKTHKVNMLVTVNQAIIETLPEELRNGLSV